MAVIPSSVEFHWAGATGSVDRDGPVEYTALWRIKVDDPLDQVQTILIWWQLNMFQLGFPYAYANDVFGSLATARNISATRQLETTDSWTVQVQYSREDDDAKKTPDDEHTTDPLQYRPIIRASSNAQTVPGHKMFYRGGLDAAIGAKIGTAATVPVNSLLKPYDPLPELDEYIWYISVEQNLATFDANESYVGYINKDAFLVNYKGFTRGPIVPFQSKIRDCEAEFMRENSVDFWKIRYYIEILPDGEDYFTRLPDIGMDSLACDGDPDLHGKTVGSGTGFTPYTEARAREVAMIDIHGMPVRSPILLNGAGRALDICGPSPIVPFFGVWWEGKEIDFNPLPVIKEVIEPVT
jgi:hypothetical protein